jgi:hypothetical protein
VFHFKLWYEQKKKNPFFFFFFIIDCLIVFCVYGGGATSFFFDSNYTSSLSLLIEFSAFLNNSVGVLKGNPSFAADVYINKYMDLTNCFDYSCSSSSDSQSIKANSSSLIYYTISNCSSTPPVKVNNTCIRSFLSLNGSSCVWNCGEGEVGAFHKCYENCDLEDAKNFCSTCDLLASDECHV